MTRWLDGRARFGVTAPSFFGFDGMSHKEPLASDEREQLDQLADDVGEAALANAIGVARLTLSRARHGSDLYPKSRQKLRAYLARPYRVAC
jgi:hypothetical protein